MQVIFSLFEVIYNNYITQRIQFQFWQNCEHSIFNITTIINDNITLCVSLNHCYYRIITTSHFESCWVRLIPSREALPFSRRGFYSRTAFFFVIYRKNNNNSNNTTNNNNNDNYNNNDCNDNVCTDYLSVWLLLAMMETLWVWSMVTSLQLAPPTTPPTGQRNTDTKTNTVSVTGESRE